MASSEYLDRRPSDRADEASDNELEQYGVWVKTAPEDVAEPEVDEDALSLSDLEDVEDDVDLFASQLTEEEEELLAPLESERDISNAAEPRVAEHSNTDADRDFDDLGNLDGIEDLDDLEDISLEDFVTDDEEPFPADEVSRTHESVEELELDVDALDLDLDEEDLDLGDLESPTSVGAETSEEERELEAELADFDLDDISLPSDMEIGEIDLEDTGDSAEDLPELELDEEDLDLELIESEDEDDTDLVEAETFLSESDSGESEDLHAVDDVAAVEAEMAGTESTARQSSTAEESILAKIEDELTAIKRELTDLRQELRVLRSRNADPQTEASEETGLSAETLPEEAETDEDGGFFEEDEDETIALTGAELDNILNTAEFTEQDGEPTEIDDGEMGFPPSEETAGEIDLEDLAADELEIEGVEAEGFDNDVPELEETMDDLTLEDEEDLGEDDEDFADFELELIEEDVTDSSIERPSGTDARGAITDFEASLGYADDDGVDLEERPPASDALAERVVESGDEIDFDISDEEDLISLEPEVTPPTEEANFEDQLSAEETPALEAEPPVEEIELEDEMEIPSLEEIEEEDITLSDEQDTIPDLDIDAELADIGELSDEPEQRIEDEEALSEEEPLGEIGEGLRESDEPLEEVAVTAPSGTTRAENGSADLSEDLKSEIRSVLSYMDQLLESLPEEKIEEFAKSEHFEVYRRLFEELGLER